MAELRHRLRVRYGECDAQGIAFNANYLAWVDVMLTETWRALFGSYTAVSGRGVDVVVAESTLRFRLSAVFDDEIEIVLTVAHLGTTSMVLRERLHRVADGALLCEVDIRYVWITLADRRKTPIPDWARAAFAPYREPVAAG